MRNRPDHQGPGGAGRGGLRRFGHSAGIGGLSIRQCRANPAETSPHTSAPSHVLSRAHTCCLTDEQTHDDGHCEQMLGHELK